MQLIWVIIGAVVLIGLWKEHAGVMIALGLIGTVLALFVAHSGKAQRAADAEEARQQREALLSAVLVSIGSHIATLHIKHEQTVIKDEYGIYRFEKWNAETDYFIDNVLAAQHLDIIDTLGRDALRQAIHDAVLTYMQTRPITPLYTDEMSPIDFEHFCAGLLRAAGWLVRLTPASGDQGVDIVASKDQAAVAIQCKKYAGSVGNAAVQQIAAGRIFVGADYGAVVTNAAYTPHAKALAATCGVHLLHYSELRMLENLLADRRVIQPQTPSALDSMAPRA
ncbi:MAG: hypothetical protein JWO88_3599 [Frankiales bacterium]|nr:hypothetical protein [Frankiales bacterium]